MRAILPTKQPPVITEVAPPTLKPREVLIKVHAAGVNRADILQRKGHYPPPAGESEVLGLEAAGEIIQVGDDCQQARVGDRVFTLLAGGGYAEYVAAHERLLMPIPSNLSFPQAAAIAEAFLTAYQALDWLGHLKKGETVLIHAAAGGVGTAAIQLAKQIGANIIATTSNESKIVACKKLGANHVINYHDVDFANVLLTLTNNTGANVILDSIGASYLKQNTQALAMDGRLIMLALQGGSAVDQFNLGVLINKRISMIGTTLRNRSLEYKAKLISEFSKNYLPLFETGALIPIIHSTIDWQQSEKAHNLLETNKTIGKVILTGM